jgi:hypothetical protein
MNKTDQQSTSNVGFFSTTLTFYDTLEEHVGKLLLLLPCGRIVLLLKSELVAGMEWGANITFFTEGGEETEFYSYTEVVFYE